jgi:hypothetical protein
MFYHKYKYKANDGPGAPLIAPWGHSDAFQRMLAHPVLLAAAAAHDHVPGGDAGDPSPGIIF